MEKIRVIITNKQKVVKIPTGMRMLVRRCCNAVLRMEKFPYSAEISVTRRINYIHLYTVVIYRRVFSKYSDTAFTFQSVGIHYTFFDMLVSTENTALFEHCVYEGSLAMVNVGNNGNIA